MSQILFVNQQRRNEILADAARSQERVVLTRQDEIGWRTCKSHFLGCNEHDQRLYIAAPAAAGQPTGFTVQPGDLLGVAFRRGHKKCLFNTKVTEISDDPSHGLEIHWPEELQELQRRAYQRVSPPPDRHIKVHFWNAAAGPENDRPRTGTIEDLSAGGMRISSDDHEGLHPGDALRVTFDLRARGPELSLDAVFRHRESRPNSACSLGLQFVGLETTREGQDTLAKIACVVIDFQRASTRHRRALPHPCPVR